VTAMTSWDLGTGVGLDLECDECGYVLLLPGADEARWQAFWQDAERVGWGGTATAAGPHSCPDCRAASPAAA
jgi:hypothetical protein